MPACALGLTAPAPEVPGALVKEQAMTATWNDTILARSDDVYPDAAWYDPKARGAAKQIAGRGAFWNGVKVGP